MKNFRSVFVVANFLVACAPDSEAVPRFGLAIGPKGDGPQCPDAALAIVRLQRQRQLRDGSQF